MLLYYPRLTSDKMKIMLTLIAVFVVLFLVAGALLSIASREGGPAGLLAGRLHPCPGTPNCVCSEYPQDAAFIEPLPFGGDRGDAWSRAERAVIDLGGMISRLEDDYLAATFETTLFRFVDDVELRLDAEAGVIHIRSASRVGRSDLGANRKRVAVLRSRFNRR